MHPTHNAAMQRRFPDAQERVSIRKARVAGQSLLCRDAHVTPLTAEPLEDLQNPADRRRFFIAEAKGPTYTRHRRRGGLNIQSGAIDQIPREGKHWPGVLLKRRNEHEVDGAPRLVEDRRVQRECIEHLTCRRATRMRKHAAEFVADPFPTDTRKLGRVPANCLSSGWLDRKSKSGGKANGSQRPKVIFLQSGLRITNSPQHTRGEIRSAADVVDDLLLRRCERIQEDCVNGEVAASGVGLGITELHVVRATPIRVRAVCAKGGYLNRHMALSDQHHTKGCSDLTGPRENGPELIGRCIGRDIKVSRRYAEQLVSHTPAREVCGMPTVAQQLNNACRSGSRGFRRTRLSVRHRHCQSVTGSASLRRA